MRRLIICLASVGYSGYFPVAPGTAGTLAGVGIFLLLHPLPAALYLLFTAVLFLLACWIAGRAEVLLGQKDSPKIVIDEVVGLLVTLALLPRRPAAILGGFLFFRVFDIIKPPPAGIINRRMKGGLAVVLDDAVAGIYANLLLQAISLWRPHLLQIVDRWFFP
ncbi:MAG: phosphatidylglycerophosphatase A [Deltaproteobacteria bacterium]|nr:phosphatidylglycerophosphatase A [Deltaproteobacteria bacterium]